MSRLEATRQLAGESLISYLKRVDTIRYHAEVGDNWLVNNVRSRVHPKV